MPAPAPTELSNQALRERLMNPGRPQALEASRRSEIGTAVQIPIA